MCFGAADRYFGELGLISSSGLRSATVTAVKQSSMLRLGRGGKHPQFFKVRDQRDDASPVHSTCISSLWFRCCPPSARCLMLILSAAAGLLGIAIVLDFLRILADQTIGWMDWGQSSQHIQEREEAVSCRKLVAGVLEVMVSVGPDLIDELTDGDEEADVDTDSVTEWLEQVAAAAHSASPDAQCPWTHEQHTAHTHTH